MDSREPLPRRALQSTAIGVRGPVRACVHPHPLGSRPTWLKRAVIGYPGGRAREDQRQWMRYLGVTFTLDRWPTTNDTSLRSKLNPHRYPNMSPQMGAIMGFLLEREYTTPPLTDLAVTADGSVIGWPADADGGPGHSLHLGHSTDLCANLRRLGMAADLDAEEWAAFAALVLQRLGVALGERDAADTLSAP